jgi:hypothetical protein
MVIGSAAVDERRAAVTVLSRRAVLVVTAVCLCALAGCFSWTEDQNGNLQSVGLPGVPLWKSKTPPPPPTPAQMGYTPDEASRLSGPILVEPPDATVRTYRYRYYQTGHNNCQADLQKILAARAPDASGLAPYCTDTSSASSASAPSESAPPQSVPPQSVPAPPPPATGSAFVF